MKKKYTEEELNYFAYLYYGDFPLKYNEMADAINERFYNCKNVITEDDIYRMQEIFDIILDEKDD